MFTTSGKNAIVWYLAIFILLLLVANLLRGAIEPASKTKFQGFETITNVDYSGGLLYIETKGSEDPCVLPAEQLQPIIDLRRYQISTPGTSQFLESSARSLQIEGRDWPLNIIVNDRLAGISFLMIYGGGHLVREFRFVRHPNA